MPFSFLEAYDFMKLNRKDVVQDEFIFDYINWGGFPLRFSFTQEREVKTYMANAGNDSPKHASCWFI
ncbi:hypothetical protein D3Z53_19515 [Lachnospiraceae bacterium]|nr:hypothetical protein [Lachnospiraceae bacterium]